MAFIFIFLFFWGSADQSNVIPHELAYQEPTISWYEKGNKLLKSGKCKDALRVWEEGKRELSKDQRHDPRIGITYICLVAEKKLKDKWSSLDPVLSTEINERVIEHWLRIDYSRKHFTRNKITADNEIPEDENLKILFEVSP